MQEPNFKPVQEDTEDLRASREQRGRPGIAEKLSQAVEGKREKIVVHYLPHSHTDLGWINTLDEYFEGVEVGREGVVKGMNKVYDIIDTAITELEKYDYRTFTFAETKFFQMWWSQQTPEKQERVRALVSAGQLELINGGWSAPDEALPPYDDLLNNWMIAHDFLVSQFGYENVPGLRIGWEQDAFGLSSGYARLARDVGMEALFLQRADHDEKEFKRKHKERIQIWRPFEENFGA